MEPVPEPADRRVTEHLSYDAAARRLALGPVSRPIPGGGNRAVLETFVVLVGECRDDGRLNRLVEVRDSDLDALAGALDLEATDLRTLLESVLGLSPQVSTRLLSSLHQRRLFLRVAAAAAGVAAVGALAAGAEARPADAPPGSTRPPAAVAAAEVASPSADGTEADPIVDGPLTVDADGVGLIPPVELDADGVLLIPPADVDQAPPGD